MRILVDTNVIIDYVADREPYAACAYKIIEMCITKTVTGCIAAHSVVNLFYILRKELSVEERKVMLMKLCRVFYVVDIDIFKIQTALKNDEFKDLEDCLQYECAKDFRADYIVTRNEKDFTSGKIKAIAPREFLAVFGL